VSFCRKVVMKLAYPDNSAPSTHQDVLSEKNIKHLMVLRDELSGTLSCGVSGISGNQVTSRGFTDVIQTVCSLLSHMA